MVSEDPMEAFGAETYCSHAALLSPGAQAWPAKAFSLDTHFCWTEIQGGQNARSPSPQGLQVAPCWPLKTPLGIYTE